MTTSNIPHSAGFYLRLTRWTATGDATLDKKGKQYTNKIGISLSATGHRCTCRSDCPGWARDTWEVTFSHRDEQKGIDNTDTLTCIDSDVVLDWETKRIMDVGGIQGTKAKKATEP